MRDRLNTDRSRRRLGHGGRGSFPGWPRRARIPAGALIALTALAVPAAAHATNACARLADCTAVEANSWLAVPAASPTGPGMAGMVVFCPQTNGFEIAAGSDYLLSGSASPFKLLVIRSLLGPGYGLTSGGDAHFAVVNFDSVAVAIKPIVGCVSTPFSTRHTTRPSPFDIQVRQRHLTPATSTEYAEQCPTGDRLLEAARACCSTPSSRHRRRS
jgi:hypothetical protein